MKTTLEYFWNLSEDGGRSSLYITSSSKIAVPQNNVSESVEVS